MISFRHLNIRTKTERRYEVTKPDIMTVLLDGVRVGGGYKYRERFPQITNQDLPAFVASSEAQLLAMARKLEIAEIMLHEWAPWWEGYVRRCGEATK